MPTKEEEVDQRRRGVAVPSKEEEVHLCPLQKKRCGCAQQGRRGVAVLQAMLLWGTAGARDNANQHDKDVLHVTIYPGKVWSRHQEGTELVP